MSKFKIYRTNFADPEHAGKRNKWYYSIYIILFFLLSQIPNYCNSLKFIKFHLPIFLIIALIIICLIPFLFYKLKSMSNSLQKIGTIEFTKNNVKKEIGDLVNTFGYDDIIKIELEDYFRDVSITWNKPDALTKSLKIVHKDLTEESFIISNKSIDFKQKISVVDSLKTLKKITGLDIQIKYN